MLLLSRPVLCLRWTWLALLVAVAAGPAHASTETFYLGTYTHAPGGSQGIYVGTLDSETGTLGPLRVAAQGVDPNYLALSPDHRLIFASLNGGVGSFAVQTDGTLRAAGWQPSGGGATCHVSVDRTGREVFVACYGSGQVAGFPVQPDGTIGPREASVAFTGSGPNHLRQESSHAHSIYADPENRFVYVCDLGTDNIWILRLDKDGGLVRANPPFASVPPGSGARHLQFDGRWVYVVNEMGVTTCVFERNAKTGSLRLRQVIDNIEGGAKAGTGSAEIALHPTGRWLYVSTRVQDVLTVFRVDRAAAPEHRLVFVQNIPSPVMFPRGFGLDPTGNWMIVGGQNGNQISVLKIDPASGRLTPTGEPVAVGSPVCVLFCRLRVVEVRGNAGHPLARRRKAWYEFTPCNGANLSRQPRRQRSSRRWAKN